MAMEKYKVSSKQVSSSGFRFFPGVDVRSLSTDPAQNGKGQTKLASENPGKLMNLNCLEPKNSWEGFSDLRILVCKIIHARLT